MSKTNFKLVPEYGATYAPRVLKNGVTEVAVNRPAPRSTNLPKSSTVVVKGQYVVADQRGRSHVLVSMDPSAVERKVALRSAREGIENPTTPSIADSLFGLLK